MRWPSEVLVDGRRVGRTRTTVAPAESIADFVVVGVEVSGRVAGVDDEGRLVLERGRGAERAIATGDVVSID